jgi:hypothetical protein
VALLMLKTGKNRPAAERALKQASNNVRDAMK